MSVPIQNFLRNELKLDEEFTGMDEIIQQALGGDTEENLKELRTAILAEGEFSKVSAEYDLVQFGIFLSKLGYREVKQIILDRIAKHKQPA